MAARAARNARYLPGVAPACAASGRRPRADELAGRAQRAPRRARPGDARDGPGAVAPPCRATPRLSSAPRASSAASGRFLSEVVAELRPAAPVAVLSGPSFAADVARGLPTAVTLACTDQRSGVGAGGGAVGAELPRLPRAPTCAASRSAGRPRTCSPSPAASSRGAGSARAPRRRSSRAASPSSCASPAPMAAEPETLMGLSGLGDLVLTCTSPQSRNFAFGERLGRGRAGGGGGRRQARRGRVHGGRARRARPRGAASTCRSRRRSRRSSPGGSASTTPSMP